MMIIGYDFHPSWEYVAWVDTETGETGEARLTHADGAARQFYQGLKGAVRVGLESTGNSHWFTDMLIRREYLHRCHKKPKAVAKVAAARKLAVKLYWMLRTQTAYPEVVRIESSPRVPLAG